MIVPFVRKVKYANDVLIERALPLPGYLNAKIGQQVEPFTKLALTKVSTEKIIFDESFIPPIGKSYPMFVYSGEKMGKVGFDTYKAPFSGYLKKEESEFLLEREPHDYWLLSGVWGEIVNLVDTKSVLIKTQTVDAGFAACTQLQCSGELVVFPNPSTLLGTHYMEKFAKDVFGTIIYSGNYASEEIVDKAISLGATGLIAGSAERKSFIKAKSAGMFLGVFMGFGQIPTPNLIYEVLKPISNRHVFLDGEKGILRIPQPEKISAEILKSQSNNQLTKYVEKGMLVVVLERPYFGYCGLVEKINESGIVVRLEENQVVLDVASNNVLAI